MPLLQEFGGGQGTLKGGLLGFPKSGKTYTSVKWAIGLHQYLSLPAPIAMFDTENGSEYVEPLVRTAHIGFVGLRSRALGDLIQVARECESGAASILIVDSVTHVWREVCDSYLKGINDVRRAKNQPLKTRLDFPDWAPIKAKWAEWTDLFLNSRLHIIICGRAGFEWDFEEREDGSGKDLVKTGIKMKTESEFGFEPSLLVEMERVQVRDTDKRLTKRFVHRATVLGDRFGVIDGAECDDPTFEFIKPHVDMLNPGAHSFVDTAAKTDLGVNEAGEDEYHREQRQRRILLEEIEGEMMRAWPGQTKDEKTSKLKAVESVFGTRSWTKVEGFNREKLQVGLEKLREIVSQAVQKPSEEECSV